MPRTRQLLLLTGLGLGGCNLVFGLEPPEAARDGAVAVDAVAAGDAAGCGTHDEDGDGVADGCDNCPHVRNAEQLDQLDGDGGGDGVGDACDPQPTQPGDRLLRFAAFDTMPPDLVRESTGAVTSFVVVNDELADAVANEGVDELARLPLATAGLSAVTVATRMRVTSFMPPENGESRRVGLWAAIDDSADRPTFPGGLLGEIALEQGILRADLTRLTYSPGPVSATGGRPPTFDQGLAASVVVTIGRGLPARMTVEYGSAKDQVELAAMVPPADVGFYTHDVGASFEYLVVYGR